MLGARPARDALNAAKTLACVKQPDTALSPVLFSNLRRRLLARSCLFSQEVLGAKRMPIRVFLAGAQHVPRAPKAVTLEVRERAKSNAPKKSLDHR